MGDEASDRLVSIGMPVYNGERYLPQAIESVLAQDHENLELIVSDNGSTDATPTIVHSYARSDPRVRFLRTQENRGAAWNFNNAFLQSRGAYFKWACVDDLVAPTYLSRCVERFEESPPSVVLCFPRTALIDADGGWVDRWGDPPDGDLVLDDPKPHRRLVQLLTNLHMGNTFHGLYRSSALRQTGLNGAFESSDRLLMAEMALLGETRLVDEVLFYRRVHPDMSRVAHPTADAVARFFDPAVSRVVVFPWTRLLVEHVASIAFRLPLAPRDRVLGMGALLREWYWKTVVRDAVQGGRQLLRRGVATTPEGARFMAAEAAGDDSRIRTYDDFVWPHPATSRPSVGTRRWDNVARTVADG